MLFQYEDSENWLFIIPGNTIVASKEERRERYHVMLLMDVGFATEVERDTFRLTSLGHDYLDAIRDNGIWERTKTAVTETGGNATIEIIKALASGFLKKKISQHTGIEL